MSLASSQDIATAEERLAMCDNGYDPCLRRIMSSSGPRCDQCVRVSSPGAASARGYLVATKNIVRSDEHNVMPHVTIDGRFDECCGEKDAKSPTKALMARSLAPCTKLAATAAGTRVEDRDSHVISLWFTLHTLSYGYSQFKDFC